MRGYLLTLDTRDRDIRDLSHFNLNTSIPSDPAALSYNPVERNEGGLENSNGRERSGRQRL
jgi:hypothetical protein